MHKFQTNISDSSTKLQKFLRSFLQKTTFEVDVKWYNTQRKKFFSKTLKEYFLLLSPVYAIAAHLGNSKMTTYTNYVGIK